MRRELAACSVGWFVSLLVCEEVLLADLCEKKILFRLKIYNRLRQATDKRIALNFLYLYKCMLVYVDPTRTRYLDMLYI